MLDEDGSGVVGMGEGWDTGMLVAVVVTAGTPSVAALAPVSPVDIALAAAVVSFPPWLVSPAVAATPCWTVAADAAGADSRAGQGSSLIRGVVEMATIAAFVVTGGALEVAKPAVQASSRRYWLAAATEEDVAGQGSEGLDAHVQAGVAGCGAARAERLIKTVNPAFVAIGAAWVLPPYHLPQGYVLAPLDVGTAMAVILSTTLAS